MKSVKKTKEQVNLELQNKFNYLELVGEYIGANEKSLIHCNKCGYEWSAVPRSVVASKNGCPKCGHKEKNYLKSLELFLSKLDTNKFELIEFADSKNITLKCKTCGHIRTTCASNIYKYGCWKCGHASTGLHKRQSKEEFLEKAKKIHEGRYDYSKVEYINAETPVIIICPEHGEFAQLPKKHLLGLGCPKCIGRNKTTEDIVALCKQVHGDNYDYSKVDYKDMKTPITIICPKHGKFQLLPYVHYHWKCGCPKCSRSHGEELVALILDKNKIIYKEQYRLNNPFKENSVFVLDFITKIKDQIYIIEYNGRLHYVPVEQFGGKLQFEKQKERDLDLRKFCNKYNIKLLEIKYDIEDSLVEEMLLDFLK